MGPLSPWTERLLSKERQSAGKNRTKTKSLCFVLFFYKRKTERDALGPGTKGEAEVHQHGREAASCCRGALLQLELVHFPKQMAPGWKLLNSERISQVRKQSWWEKYALNEQSPKKSEPNINFGGQIKVAFIVI